MKKIFLATVLFILINASNIEWIKDIDKAINLAKNENKNLLLIVSSKHCPYCKKMEKDIFNDKDSQKYLLKRYILVKLDIKEAKKISLDTKVTPTTYIFTPNKELLASQVGYQNEEFFYYTLTNADNKLKELKKDN